MTCEGRNREVRSSEEIGAGRIWGGDQGRKDCGMEGHWQAREGRGSLRTQCSQLNSSTLGREVVHHFPRAKQDRAGAQRCRVLGSTTPPSRQSGARPLVPEASASEPGTWRLFISTEGVKRFPQQGFLGGEPQLLIFTTPKVRPVLSMITYTLPTPILAPGSASHSHLR